MILPGVTGCSQANYVKDMVCYALNHGYRPVVVNSLISKDEGSLQGDYRVLDFSDMQVMRSAVDLVH